MATSIFLGDELGTLARATTFLAALLLSPALQAQTQAPSNPEAPAANPVNSITPIALQQGAIACVGRVNQLSNFLGFGPQAGAVLMLPPSQPDQHILPIAMEVPLEGTVAYIAATFAPNQANGCGAVYDAVMYWQQSCDLVVSQQFAGFKRVGQLKRAITVLDGGPTSKVFLMPAGSGCLSIKKEVVL